MAKVYTESERTLILNVLKYFEEEKRTGTFSLPVKQAKARTAAATGLSQDTIRRIRNEAHLPENPSSSVNKQKLNITSDENGPRKKHQSLSESDITSLGEIVNSFFTSRNELPTLPKVFDVAKNKLGFSGSKESLRTILINRLGCEFKRCKETNRVIILPNSEKSNEELESQSNNLPVLTAGVADTFDVTTMIPFVTAELGEDDTAIKSENGESLAKEGRQT